MCTRCVAACAACSSLERLSACICQVPAKGLVTCLMPADPLPAARAAALQFEPVYMDDEGNWMAPSLNYMEKRTDWQAYIDKNVFKQDWE